VSQQINEAELDGICRDASARPISSYPATWNEDHSPLEDYYYTVWIRLAEHLRWENPQLFAKEDSQSNAQWLRTSVFHLVNQNQATTFDPCRMLDKLSS